MHTVLFVCQKYSLANSLINDICFLSAFLISMVFNQLKGNNFSRSFFFFLKKDVERVKQQPENLKHVKEARENKDSGVSEAEEDGEETNRPRTERDSVYQDLDTETLYKRLQEVDPVYASRTHPNNRRKLLRYQQSYRECLQKVSGILFFL